jgi:hypothetical protein
VPGLLVQAFMIGTVLAYFYTPSTREIFDTLADWKSRWGYAYSSVSAILAGAVVPEVLRILLFQKGRPNRKNLGNFLFAATFWGYSGIQVDFFYRMQAVWFGSGAEFTTVLKKVLVDQFVYCPVIAAPIGGRRDSGSRACPAFSRGSSTCGRSSPPSSRTGASGFPSSRRSIRYPRCSRSRSSPSRSRSG